MNREILNRQERVLIATEVRQFFSHPRCLHLVPFLVGGVMLVLWPHFSSPFVSIFIVVFAGLEPQFSNIFFRTSNELEALSLLPTGWQSIIKAKNLSTLFVLFTMLPIASATLLYFSPSHITLDETNSAGLYLLTVLFPLIHVGNMRSVQHPRRECGWQVDDLAGVVELLISLVVLSIPYLVFAEIVELPSVCFLYFVASVAFWWHYSIKKTADLLESRRIEICLTV